MSLQGDDESMLVPARWGPKVVPKSPQRKAEREVEVLRVRLKRAGEPFSQGTPNKQK